MWFGCFLFVAVFIYCVINSMLVYVPLRPQCLWFFRWRKIEAAILASVASVLLVGVALVRKLRRRRLPRAPYVNHAAKREHYINSIMHGSERLCVSQIRMKPIPFHHLCHILTEGEHVRPTFHMSVQEQVLIFWHIIGQNVRFRVRTFVKHLEYGIKPFIVQ